MFKFRGTVMVARSNNILSTVFDSSIGIEFWKSRILIYVNISSSFKNRIYNKAPGNILENKKIFFYEKKITQYFSKVDSIEKCHMFVIFKV